MASQLPKLIPPFRYAMVEEDLFRGAYPKPRNYRFLRRLQLKTILSLIPDMPTPELQAFCKDENIHMLRLTVDRMKEDNIPLSYNKTILALQIIIDPENHPLYIHCLDGADVTGLVIACLRKLQMWSLSSALLEFSRNLHTSVISSEESEFVEHFKNFEVTIPVSIRSWLWGGKVNFRRHSSLRLKFLNPEMMTDEERELKQKEKRKEKEKEDFYKKRKNDLLDNLFDSPSSGSSRSHHRANSIYTSSAANSNNTSNSSINNNTNNENNNSTHLMNKSSHSSNNSSTSSLSLVAIGSHNNSAPGSGTGTSKVGSPCILSEDTSKRSPKVTMTNDKDESRENNDDLVGRRQQRRNKSSNDQYLVDVDVDIEGVMMDGLDQVYSGYYDNDNSDGLMVDDLGIMYDDNSTSRYMEPISKTLEALALEGLD
ncbi:tyrosine phosphatase family-domain-containing protein [Halteromyces radiatus]|uniref:tyrosine phosphatase family-domain-containing protein n=1 Tax=Halteromyces radiatus TaxID=101107 RepID=UPI00221F6488|nr:tyrosine phosphatase family-domain-containing protein [Halteromyces radiatus]KAI8089983.1 tyrosine phosphatase family-domain-containing protein [Halteromyces radiatus]